MGAGKSIEALDVLQPFTTAEFAKLARTTDQSVRRQYAKNGHYLGVVPVKGGRDLLWPAARVARALSGTDEPAPANVRGRPAAQAMATAA
jgi:hypothetical protein